MKLVDYIKKYESKTGEKFEPKEGFELIFSPEHGFCEIAVHNQSIFVWQLCGDVRWWFGAISDVVCRMGLRYIVTYIIRHVRPFIRIFGYRISKEKTAFNGTQQFICIDKCGRKMIASTLLNDKNEYVGAIISWDIGGSNMNFDLQMFKGGKGSTQTVKHEYAELSPEAKQLQNLALNYANSAAPMVNTLTGTASNLLQNNYGTQNVDYGALTNGSLNQIGQAQAGVSDLTQGKLPTAFTDNMTAALQSGVNNTVGTAINGLANNGVLNSSVTGEALNDVSKNVSNTMAQQYTNNIGTLSNLYNQQSGSATDQIKAAAGGQQAALQGPLQLINAGSSLQNSAVNQTLGQLISARTGGTTTTSGGGGGGFLTNLLGTALGVGLKGGF